jgi:hypothetical protein
MLINKQKAGLPLFPVSPLENYPLPTIQEPARHTGMLSGLLLLLCFLLSRLLL